MLARRLLMSAGVSLPNIAGLELWLKADSVTGKSDGDRVTLWSDSSGNGHDASSGTGPVYKTGIVNGRPVLRFAGVASETMTNTTISLAQPGTVFFVYYPTTDNVVIFDGGAGGRWYFIHEITPGDTKIRLFVSGSALSDAGMVDDNQWNIIGVTIGTTSATFYTPSGTFGTRSIGTASLINYWIGDDVGVSNRYFQGDIAEIIIYNSELGSVDRGSVFSYLQTKYGQ